MKDGYVLLCPNAHRDHGLASTLAIAEALREHGHEVRISPFLSDGLKTPGRAISRPLLFR